MSRPRVKLPRGPLSQPCEASSSILRVVPTLASSLVSVCFVLVCSQLSRIHENALRALKGRFSPSPPEPFFCFLIYAQPPLLLTLALSSSKSIMSFIVNEALFDRLKRAVSGKSLHEKIGISSTSGSEAQHPSGATPYDEHVDEECLFQNGDWEAVTERLCILEAQGKELNARQLALRAFSLSKLDYLDECRNYAMTSIEKDPTEPLAYCTMAAGASRKELFHDARLWLSLAHATGKTDKEPEFEREGKAIRYAAATCTSSNAL